MLLKYIGAFLLMGSAVFYSLNRLKRERLQRKSIQECIDLLRYIYRNIECFRKPLPDIIGDYESTYLKEHGFFDALQKQNILSAFESLKPCMSSEAYSVMQAYGKSAGKGYKEEELQLCRYTCDTLQMLSEKLNKDSQTHAKMTKTLPFLFALSAVLLFW